MKLHLAGSDFFAEIKDPFRLVQIGNQYARRRRREAADDLGRIFRGYVLPMNGKSQRESDLLDACLHKHHGFRSIGDTGYLNDSSHGNIRGQGA
jgi:hypothetical protein